MCFEVAPTEIVPETWSLIDIGNGNAKGRAAAIVTPGNGVEVISPLAEGFPRYEMPPMHLHPVRPIAADEVIRLVIRLEPVPPIGMLTFEDARQAIVVFWARRYVYGDLPMRPPAVDLVHISIESASVRPPIQC